MSLIHFFARRNVMNVNSNAKDTSVNDERALIDLLNNGEAIEGLESLFTPLQSNNPVEQFVRRS